MPQVVRANRFDERVYRRTVEQDEELQALRDVGNNRVAHGWEEFQKDLFNAHYKNVVDLIEQDQANRPFRELLETLALTEEHQTLRQLTTEDPIMSAIAVINTGQEIMPALQAGLIADMNKRAALDEQRRATQEDLDSWQYELDDRTQEDPNDPEIPGIQGRIRELMEEIKDVNDRLVCTPDVDHDDDLAVVRRAYRDGARKAIELLTFMSGAGTGLGMNTGSMGVDAQKQLAKQLSSNKKLQQIFLEAGRINQIVGAKIADVVPDRREEKVGVVMGNMPVHDILIRELALAGHPASRLLFAKKYAERGLMVKKWAGKQQMGAGPIIILRDDSGSMMGRKEVWAKAITLAFMNLANRDKRDVYVMAFSSYLSDARMWLFPYREAPEKVTWTLTLDCLTTFLDGGTDFEHPLTWAADKIEAAIKPGGDPLDKPWEKADVIMITDGVCNISPTWEQKFLDRKAKTGFHTFGVLLGCQAPSLKRVIDEMTTLNDLSGAQNDSSPGFKLDGMQEQDVIGKMFRHAASH